MTSDKPTAAKGAERDENSGTILGLTVPLPPFPYRSWEAFSDVYRPRIAASKRS